MGLLSAGLGNLISGKSFSGSTKQRDRSKKEPMQSFKRGGKVKRTGMAKVHRGERVLTVQQQHRLNLTNKQLDGYGEQQHGRRKRMGSKKR